MATIVYKYGLFPPTENVEIIEDQIQRGHRFRNKLNEFEIERRNRIRKLEEPLGIREMYGQISDVWARKHKGDITEKEAKALTDPIYEQIRQLRETPEFQRKLYEIDGNKNRRRFFDEQAAKEWEETQAERKAQNALKKTMSKAEWAEYKRANKKKRAQEKKPRIKNNSIINKMIEKARQESGLFWGTYCDIEEAVNQSFKKLWNLYDGREDNNPKFRVWTREGRVANQLQAKGEVTVLKEDVFSDTEHKYVTIKPVDEDTLLHCPSRAKRREARKTKLRMAISGKHSKIEFAEWPMLVHRPIPDGASIKWVKVTKTMVGPKVKWTCAITVDFPDNKPSVRPARPRRTGRGSVAVVLGWRRLRKDYIRVATWIDTSGMSGTFELLDAYKDGHRPAYKNRRKDVDGGYGGIIDGVRRSSELRKIRVNNFNEARDEMLEFLQQFDELPEWLRRKTVKRDTPLPSTAQALAYIKQWKSEQKLGAFARTWAHKRFDRDSVGDKKLDAWKKAFNTAHKRQRELQKEKEDKTVRVMIPKVPSGLKGFAALEAWRYHDYHLWQWERLHDVTARGRRKEVYRNLAAKLARKYNHVIVDGTDFKGVKEIKADTPKGMPKAQTLGQSVACGELRLCLEQGASHYGAKYTKSSAVNTSRRCPSCGKTHKANREGETHTFACANCGFVCDIASVRVLNMLNSEGHKEEVARIISGQGGSLRKLEEAIDG